MILNRGSPLRAFSDVPLGECSRRGHQSGPEGECPVIILQYPRGHGASPLMPELWWTVGNCHFEKVKVWEEGWGHTLAPSARRCWGGIFSKALYHTSAVHHIFVFSRLFHMPLQIATLKIHSLPQQCMDADLSCCKCRASYPRPWQLRK